MYRLFTYFILLTFSYTVSAQITCFPMTVKPNDFVYDSNTDRIYAIIDDTDTNYPNTLAIINPQLHTVENTYSIGVKAVNMAMSDDGQFIYIALDNVPMIKRFNITNLSFDMEFGLGIDTQGHGNYYARKIEVVPGNPNIIAVVRKVIDNVSPDFAGIGIYADGIMLPIDYHPIIGEKIVTQMHFKDSSTLIGHCASSSSASLVFFNVDASGIASNASFDGMPNPNPYGGETSDFIIRQNKLYFLNGKSINITGTPFIEGTFNPDARGGVLYNEQNNLVYFARSTNIFTYYLGGFWDGQLKRYDPITYNLVDSTPITTGSNVPKMISCGNGCYALKNVTTSTPITPIRLVIIHDQALATSTFSNTDIKVFPNPSKDYVTISAESIVSTSVYDMNGRNILYQTGNTIDLRDFNDGLYLLKAVKESGETITRTIIKE